jgi:hypothetical protein
MQRNRHSKIKYLLCLLLLAAFSIGTVSAFVVDKVSTTSESSLVKEKETDDKYCSGIDPLFLTYTHTTLQHQPALFSFLYQSVYIEITPPPPNCA